MTGKVWSLAFAALALLAFAALAPARADPQQYFVTYVEFQPAFKEVGGELLAQLAKLAKPRRNNAAVRFDVYPQIGRPNFYVLIEIWDSEDTRNTFQNLPKPHDILSAIEPLLEAPFDERQGTLIQAGKVSQKGPQPGEIEVVTHIDIIPTFLDQATNPIQNLVALSGAEAGVKEFLLVSWLNITNHFQLIERFRDMRAFNAHVSADHTTAFRDQVQNPTQPFIGAPYDERLYRVD
jgi:quinol monooxygenase YgiN